MIAHFAAFLGFQLIGEVITRALDLSLPGPVIGMALLTVVLMARPQFGDDIASTANGFLAHLSVLYVPAGVGIAPSMSISSTALVGRSWPRSSYPRCSPSAPEH